MKVRISLTTKAEYTSVVEITPEKFKELSDRLEKHDKKVEEEIFALVDAKNDWMDENVLRCPNSP